MERDRERHQVERNNRPAKRDAKMSAPGRLCQAGTAVPAGEMEMKEPPTGFRNQEPSSQEEDAAGGPRGRQTDWDGGGVSVCLYLCMCVWELLSLFNRHCKRKQKIYSNTTKIKGIVNSRINILPLFTHFHVILNLSVGHKKRIFHEKFICLLIILPFKLLTVRTSVSQWLRELNSRTESINKNDSLNNLSCSWIRLNDSFMNKSSSHWSWWSFNEGQWDRLVLYFKPL